jgi:hypothetical protein
MMVIGIDAHKRSHTAVTVDEMGRQGFVKTVGTTTQDHLRLLKWAVGLAEERSAAQWRHCFGSRRWHSTGGCRRARAN